MKKILIGIILGLSSIISQAAPTDCRQLAEDGEIDCIKATSWFGYNRENLFPTFEGYVAYLDPNLSCHSKYNVCYIQYENNPPEPPEGREPTWYATYINNSDFPYTRMNYNTNKNDAGWVVRTYYYTDPTRGDIKIYSKEKGLVYHFRICPENTINIDAGVDTYLRYCKPNPIPKNTPTSCDTSCNASSGNVSVGN